MAAVITGRHIARLLRLFRHLRARSEGLGDSKFGPAKIVRFEFQDADQVNPIAITCCGHQLQITSPSRCD